MRYTLLLPPSENLLGLGMGSRPLSPESGAVEKDLLVADLKHESEPHALGIDVSEGGRFTLPQRPLSPEARAGNFAFTRSGARRQNASSSRGKGNQGCSNGLRRGGSIRRDELRSGRALLTLLALASRRSPP